MKLKLNFLEASKFFSNLVMFRFTDKPKTTHCSFLLKQHCICVHYENPHVFWTPADNEHSSTEYLYRYIEIQCCFALTKFDRDKEDGKIDILVAPYRN